jgi:DNA-directed RNA polymerase specialized sigma24 family protein
VKGWGIAEDLVQDIFIKAYKNIYNVREFGQSKKGY